MQSRRQSLIEAITNVVVGYALAVLTQIVVFPWFEPDRVYRRRISSYSAARVTVFRLS